MGMVEIVGVLPRLPILWVGPLASLHSGDSLWLVGAKRRSRPVGATGFFKFIVMQKQG